MSCTTPSWQCAVRDDHHPALLSHPAHRCTTRPLHAKLEGAPLPSVLRPPPAVPQLEAAARTTLATPFNGGVHSTEGRAPRPVAPSSGGGPRGQRCASDARNASQIQGSSHSPNPAPAETFNPGPCARPPAPRFAAPASAGGPRGAQFASENRALFAIRGSSHNLGPARRAEAAPGPLARHPVPRSVAPASVGGPPGPARASENPELMPCRHASHSHISTDTAKGPPGPRARHPVQRFADPPELGYSQRDFPPPSHGNPADAGSWPRAPDGTAPRGSTAGPLAKGALRSVADPASAGDSRAQGPATPALGPTGPVASDTPLPHADHFDAEVSC